MGDLRNSDLDLEHVAPFVHDRRGMLVAYLSYALEDIRLTDERTFALLQLAIQSLRGDVEWRHDAWPRREENDRPSVRPLKTASSSAETSRAGSEDVSSAKLSSLLAEVGNISSIELRDAAIFDQAVERLAKTAHLAEEILAQRRTSLQNIAALEKQIDRRQAETSRMLAAFAGG